MVESPPYALGFAEIVAAEARHRGARPVIFYDPEAALYGAHQGTEASDWSALAQAEVAAVAASDGYVLFPATPEDRERRERLPRAHREAVERRAQEWSQVLVRNSVPSVLMLAATATESAAVQYGVNLPAWRRECFRAGLVDPRDLQRAARPLQRALHRGRRVTISHPNGTHLELKLAGRTPVVDDGRVDAHDLAAGRVWTTIPSGFLLVAVDENTAEGRFLSNRPSRHRRGVIEGMSWTFRDGRLREVEIDTGRTIFESSYRRGGPGRSRPALLSIGLNSEIRDFPLAEDQERGVVTLYIGGNDDLGGTTHGPFRDYALLRGATVSVDGQPIVRSGKLG